MVWVTAVVLDFHLLAYGMTELESHQHILKTATMTTLAVSAGSIILLLFTLIGLCNGNSFSSTKEQDASFLPPFGTSLIVANLKSTTCFTVVLLLTVLIFTRTCSDACSVMSTSRCSCRTIVARSPSIEKQTSLKSLNLARKTLQVHMHPCTPVIHRSLSIYTLLSTVSLVMSQRATP